jgi:general secretion pathway protein E
LSDDDRLRYEMPVGTRYLYQADGCEYCNSTGYKGRTGIHELLMVDDAVREAIHAGQGELAIERLIRANTASIRHDGLQKVANGETTLEEVLRVTREE